MQLLITEICYTVLFLIKVASNQKVFVNCRTVRNRIKRSLEVEAQQTDNTILVEKREENCIALWNNSMMN